MSLFEPFALAVKKNVDSMSNSGLFVTATDKDVLWDLYLSSFPEGTNPVYRERTEHDCTCCKQFIRNIGNVVTINNDLSVTTVWDGIQLGNEYDVVAKALADYVRQNVIVDVYFNDSKTVSVAQNYEQGADGKVRTYNHFHAVLDSKFVLRPDAIAAKKGELRGSCQVFGRSMEISVGNIETVLELIEQNSLYRGTEHLETLKSLLGYKRQYDALPTDASKELWVWKTAQAERNHMALRFRNTVIGTLLVDLQEGKSLEESVKAFEYKVAPANYKRTTALVTQNMIKDAQEKVIALGLEDSLARRYAKYDDLTINNVLFSDLEAQQAMDPFAQIAADVKVSQKSLDKIEEVSVKDFINNILPKAHRMEVLVENGHTGNLFSLIAPVNQGAPSLFHWDNPFSWSYNGEVTDSIKSRVKSAGGNVDGYLRVSLAWYNNDDLDLHMHTPAQEHIYYRDRGSVTGGTLDIDMNGMDGICKTRDPVENIVFTDERKLRDGVYRFDVHNYSQRETCDVGFQIEVEYKGEVKRYAYDKAVKTGQVLKAVTLTVRDGKVVDIKSELSESDLSKEVWGIKTAVYTQVQLVLESPNFWDGKQKGNHHLFFVLKGCQNPDSTRGFYNEYLKGELAWHSKVFEVLSSKMKVPYGPEQLSGVGFSSTVRNHLFVKVSGAFNRVVKVIF